MTTYSQQKCETSITIIGNKTTPDGSTIADGGRIRVALYHDLLKKEGFHVNFIELQGWRSKLLHVVFKVWKSIRNSDIVLIIGGPYGARFLTKLCVFLNYKKRTRLVLSMLGIGPIQQKIRHLTPENLNQFIHSQSTFGISDYKFGNTLRKLDLVLAQNDIILNWYKNYYQISNIEVLENFRVTSARPEDCLLELFDDKYIDLIFFSRVNRKKGIFDIISAIKTVNNTGNQAKKIRLDIYGEKQFDSSESVIFDSLLDENISYKGVVENSRAISTINKYIFSVFPSKYPGEGTPGSIIESFLAGTPVLTSSFSQAKILINDKVDGLIYDINDQDSLINSLNYILNLDEHKIREFRSNARKNGDKYDYCHNRLKFIKLITGKEWEVND